MKQSRNLHRWLAAALCLAVVAGCTPRAERSDRAPSAVSRVDEPSAAQDAFPAPAAETSEVDGSFGAATAGFDLTVPDGLAVTRPAEDLTLDAEYYYITGVSDPTQELLLNDEIVADGETGSRGRLGSFGVYVELEEGKNVFTFTQDDATVTVTITRGDEKAEPATTDVATRMRPELTVAARAGKEYLLSCIAPAGGTVTATVGGETVELTQAAATELDGVPATYTGSFTPENVIGTVNMGPVVYTVEYGGGTNEFPSAGELFISGEDADLVVRGASAASTVFTEANDSAFYSLLPRGAVDVVTEIGSNMYRLGMGGWVYKDAVEPLEGEELYKNVVESTLYTVTEGEKYETLTISGAATPPYTADWGDGEDGDYSITLHHTVGFGPVIGGAVGASGLLEGIDIAEEDGDTTLTFRPAKGGKLGGYLVSYDGTDTIITIKEPLALAGGDQPLAGLTIALDPGHGGSDVGTRGVAWDLGPSEKDINLATAGVVQRYLQSLGAAVMLLREDDSRVELDERLDMIRAAEVDTAISLHCNNVPEGRDGTGPNGVETYYHEMASQPLAAALQAAICGTTGRTDRGDKHSYFKVTLNSGAPSVLVEMGFLCNPVEYDDLCTPEAAYDLAMSIGDALIDTLG